MIRIFISLLLSTLHTLVSADEICCCPDLTVYLKCTDKTSDSDPNVKTSFLKANGYVCDSLEGTDVTLECNVADVDHQAVKPGSIKYSYYKAHEIGADKIVAYDTTKSKKIEACVETESTCTLTDVKWSGEVYSTTKFDNFDNFLYQCIVEITLIDETTFELPSNTMLLDVYKNEPEPNPNVVTEEPKTPLNTDKKYEKLTCGSDTDKLPSTNPRTRAKWSFKELDQDDTQWAVINIPEHKPRMGLVEPDIADESNDFLEGTLILMLFNPTQDTGHYKCEAEYETTTVGESNTYLRAQYKITGNDQQDQGSPETQMLSAITSDTFTEKGGHVDFTCYARDTDASVENKFQWLHVGDPDVLVDPASDKFNDVQILNHGRTLRLPSEYKYNGYEFKCQVAVTNGDPIFSEKFTQPVIAPEVMYIPINTRSCSNSDSAIELSSDKSLMLANEVEGQEQKQILSGATFRWMLNKEYVTAFNNPSKENQPGITTEEKLKIPLDVFDNTFAKSAQKCRYFTLFQSRSNGYQLPEVLKLTRSSDNSCTDLDCSAVTVTANCLDSTFTVSLGGSNAQVQCLSVEIQTEDGTSVYNKPFDKVASSCSDRTLEMTVTKENMGQEKVQGKYTVIVTSEGEQACSKTADCVIRCSKPVLGDFPNLASITPDTAEIQSGLSYTISCNEGFVPDLAQLVCGADQNLSSKPKCDEEPASSSSPVAIIIIVVVVVILVAVAVILAIVCRKEIRDFFIREPLVGKDKKDKKEEHELRRSESREEQLVIELPASKEGPVYDDAYYNPDIPPQTKDGEDSTPLSSLALTPHLSTGTLGYNLDPYNTFSDEELWNTLDQFQLKPYFTGKDGLLTPIEEMDSNIAVELRTLLRLARAVLLKESSTSALLVLEEVPADACQDSTPLSGTLRDYLDPKSTFSDEELWNTLDQFQLKPYFTDKDGLETSIEDIIGDSITIGLTPLLSLVRDLLKECSRRAPLVVEEAPVNVRQVEVHADSLI